LKKKEWAKQRITRAIRLRYASSKFGYRRLRIARNVMGKFKKDKTVK